MDWFLDTVNNQNENKIEDETHNQTFMENDIKKHTTKKLTEKIYIDRTPNTEKSNDTRKNKMTINKI